MIKKWMQSPYANCFFLLKYAIKISRKDPEKKLFEEVIVLLKIT